MGVYIARRALAGLFTLWVVTIAVSLLIHLVPGDPVRIMYAQSQSTGPEQIEAKRRELGLDRPIPEQYLMYMSNVLRGDLGKTIRGEVAAEVARLAGNGRKPGLAAVLVGEPRFSERPCVVGEGGTWTYAELRSRAALRPAGDRASIIDVEGELTAFAEAVLMDAYNQASDGQARAIILNFEDLEYMNSSGIGLLVTLLVRASPDTPR